MSRVYRVEGMTCGGCTASVERAIREAISGVSVEVELDGGLVSVTGTEDDNRVQQAVEDAGFTFAGRV